MYKVEFGKFDGRIIRFENISKIEYGKDMRNFSLVDDKDIFSTNFSERGFFHLIGDKINVSYHDSETAYVSITI